MKKFIILVFSLHFFYLFSIPGDSEVFDCGKYKEATKKLLAAGKSAVSHDLSGGRFGDNLICFLHALSNAPHALKGHTNLIMAVWVVQMLFVGFILFCVN